MVNPWAPQPEHHAEYSALVQAMRLSTGGGLRPHPDQAIAGLPAILSACWGPDGEPCAGGSPSVIVLALDGVGFDIAAQIWSPDLMTPLSTTFPSTSSSAWLSAVTGRRVDQHLVPGVRYRLPATGKLIDCFADDPWGTAGGPPPTGTIFDLLAARRVFSVAVLGEVATWGAHWRETLCHGARIHESATDWDRLRFEPVRLARAALAELGHALRATNGAAARLAWCWIDLDDAVHRRGYAPDVRAALADIEAAADGWRRAGHTVIAVSDHGLIATSCPAHVARAWRAASAPALCRLPPGGAGRVRWCYPRRGRAAEITSRLTDAMGDDALVLDREQLAELGLLRLTRPLRARIGEVVVVATGERFPVPDPRSRFEHGGITPQEMIVPLAVWLPGGRSR